MASQIALHGLAAPHTPPAGRRPATVAQPPPSCRNAARPSRSRLCVAADDKAWEPSDRAKSAIASAGEVRSQSSAAAGTTGNRPLILRVSAGARAGRRQRAAEEARKAVKREIERAEREIARLEAEQARLLAGEADAPKEEPGESALDWLHTDDAVNALDSLMNELAQVVRARRHNAAGLGATPHPGHQAGVLTNEHVGGTQGAVGAWTDERCDTLTNHNGKAGPREKPFVHSTALLSPPQAS